MTKTCTSILLLLLIQFSLKAHVELLTPKGGETFLPGDTVLVEWQILIPHNTLNWDLYYTTNGGESWDPIQLDIDLSFTSYEWVVPDVATTMGQIRIIQDNDESQNYGDQSNDFTITAISSTADIYRNIKLTSFPNPVSGICTIEFQNPTNEDLDLTIFNLQGLLIRRIHSIQKSPIFIDMQEFSKGMYIIQLHALKSKNTPFKLVVN